LKNDLLFVFQKQCHRLDTNSKCQYENEVRRQKNSHIDDDLILVSKQQTHTVEVITVRLKAIFNTTVFDGGPRCHIDTCFWSRSKKRHFWNVPKASFSLTVMTLTVHMAIFEYQNQVIFNTTVFDGGPRCHIDSRDIPAQIIPSVGIFRYKVVSQ
jgi:hypothetical protein